MNQDARTSQNAEKFDLNKSKEVDLEAEAYQAERRLSRSDGENGVAIPEEDAVGGEELPFSKARCIGLIVTVSGASILNACIFL